jgi:hypothetical protein
MARFVRLKVLNRMNEAGMLPVFNEADIEVAKKVAAAVFSGGCPFLLHLLALSPWYSCRY